MPYLNDSHDFTGTLESVSEQEAWLTNKVMSYS